MMKFIEDEHNSEVILGNIRIRGFISDEKCRKCNNVLIYYERHDALFCAECNKWVEKKCGDLTASIVTLDLPDRFRGIPCY
ncbi:MAG: hypothetical protein SCK29_01955 [Bacillota bacterium]|nr:hypothetical protein [Bacillota bacterium]MDW7682866.1 hypothetical protein [Bacillota bacterium]